MKKLTAHIVPNRETGVLSECQLVMSFECFFVDEGDAAMQ